MKGFIGYISLKLFGIHLCDFKSCYCDANYNTVFYGNEHLKISKHFWSCNNHFKELANHYHDVAEQEHKFITNEKQDKG